MGTTRGMIRKTSRKAYTFPKRRKTSPALTKLKGELAKSRKTSSALRKRYKGNFFSGSGIKPMAVLTITGGGAAAGASKIYMPTIMGFSTPLVAGAGLVAASMLMKDDTYAPALGAIGAGMLSAWASDASAMALLPAPAADSTNGQ